MRITALSSVTAAVAIMVASPGAAKQAPDRIIAAAVAAPDRAAANVKLDADRKPAQVLAFEGLKPGDQVADIMAGEGYYSEIMARVVGAKGRVTAFNPEQFERGDETSAPTWAALIQRNPNVSHVAYSFEAFTAPANSYSFVMLHLDYHDLYWVSEKFGVVRTDPAAFLAVVFAATKPGGTVAVIDHVALPGDTRQTVDMLHRIDPETVKADFKAAGFVFDGSSDLLRNPADDHTKLVFDPAIRGKTDRFVFRFKKPRG